MVNAMKKFNHFLVNNDFFKSLSKSFLLCLPLFIIGSFTLLLTNFPVPSYIAFLEKFANGKVKLVLDYISRGTFDVISVALVISICYNYASIKKQSSVSIFLMVITGICSYFALVYEPLSQNAFGIKNLFTSIVVCVISCNIYLGITRILNQRKKRFLGNANYLFYQVIQSILPTIITIGLAALVKVLLSIIFDISDINAIIAMPFTALFKAIKSNFLSGFLYVLLVHLFWSIGVHGGNVLESVVVDNFMITGRSSQVFTKTLNDTFILMGGCGVLLALVIAILLFSKQKSTKKLGLVSLVTVPFNINELMIFGLPIVLNPYFIIPFIATPIVTFLISYLAMSSGIVPLPTQEVGWTTPIIFSGYLATGSVSGALLQLFNLTLSVFIYMPFVKQYDKALDKQLMDNVGELQKYLFAEMDEGRIPNLLHAPGNLSGVALLIINDIDDGIKNNRFKMFYQGQFDHNAHCYGAEALLRFKFREQINIAPPLIIELAKESNLCYQLEKHLFNIIVNDLKKKELADLVISFNITIPTLMNPHFEEDVLAIIGDDEALAKRINIELTEESSFNNNDDSIIGKIQRLSKKGFVFSIDDFGMGHTSLLYLQTNCFRELKLDGSLVKQLLSDNTNEKIIASIVYLSNTIGFTVVAEYVETIAEVKKLQGLNVNCYQGFYYAKPMPYEDFIKALISGDFWRNEE